MPPLKILIIGAGIAGNSLALWLSKLGHSITVLERFPSLRTSGLQLDLRSHGIEVMKRMGLEEAFRAKLVEEQGLQVVDRKGRRRAWFPKNEEVVGDGKRKGNEVQGFTSEFEIMRGDFCEVLVEAVEKVGKTKYVFGGSVEGFEEKEKDVEVRFKDGNIERFDLLVGADGQGSRTRKLMLGTQTNEVDKFFYPLGGPNGGMYIAYFLVPLPIRPGEECIATLYNAPGNRGIMTRRHSPTHMQVYIGGKPSSDRLNKARKDRNVKEQKLAIAEIFQGAGWQSEEICNAMIGNTKDEDFYCESPGLVKLEAWSKGRVVLVGDAAHCPSPTTGMGTTSAVVGAYILAGEIGKHCGRGDGSEREGIAKALQDYEEKFRPFMEQVQEGILEAEERTTWDWVMGTAPGISLLNLFLGIASFFRVNVAKYLLAESVKNWNLPEYEGMGRK